MSIDIERPIVTTTSRLSQLVRLLSVFRITVLWLLTFLIFGRVLVVEIVLLLVCIAAIVADVQRLRGKSLPYVSMLWPLSLTRDWERLQAWRARIAGNRLIRRLGIVSERDEYDYAAELRHFDHGHMHRLRLSVPHAKLTTKVLDNVAGEAEPFMRSTWHEVTEAVPGEFCVIWRLREPENPLNQGRAYQSHSEDIVGRNLEGQNVSLRLLDDPWHTLIQGQTRSGKSAALYVILSQLAKEYRHGRLIIGGVDPSGLLLAPFEDWPHPEYRAIGLLEMAKIAEAIAAVVAEMDSRIFQMRRQGLDRIEPSVQTPGLVFLLEEYPGLLSALDSYDKTVRTDQRIASTVRMGVQRLIQEGAKAGIRVIIVAQRADASFIGGSERSNIGLRVSLRVDNSDAIRMLFPDLASDSNTVRLVGHFPAGQALIGLPPQEPRVIRFDHLSYSDYLVNIRSVLRGDI